MDSVIGWLLEGSPWVKHRTQIDLLGQSEDDPQVQMSRQAMLAHPQIQKLLVELAGWENSVLKSHKAAGHLLHKLTFAADLGLKASDPEMVPVVDRILAHQSEEGLFQILVNIKPGYGGTGENQWAWMLCDAPLVMYALVKLGLGEDDRIQEGVEFLVNLIRENGWPCAAAPDLGKFRGPGRKADPCPYANLVMLKFLSQLPNWSSSASAKIGTETLLSLWKQRKERRPYMFAMGTNFGKLKAPLIWYDILHLTEILTQFEWLGADKRLKELVDLVANKKGDGGKFKAESVWRNWKEWDFGQKREPSEWITLLVYKMINRYEKNVLSLKQTNQP